MTLKTSVKIVPILAVLCLYLSIASAPGRASPSAAGDMFTLIWSSVESASTNSVAWGDVDGDGDLDLAVGNAGQPVRLYKNDSGVLSQIAVWSSSKSDTTRSLAWGDVDGDGDLDLAVGNIGQPNRLYQNDGGILSQSPVWSSDELDNTYSVAWGDVDGDGDLDLAVGNDGSPDRLYRNDNGTLTSSAVWSSTDIDSTRSLAWGDVDRDGDLDLATGNWGQPNLLYRNESGVLTQSAVWSSNESDYTTSVAWGDANGDGYPDLAAGNYNSPNRVYLNENGSLLQSAAWSSIESDYTTSVAWGDVDGDGDLDLATGNNNYPIRLYRNDEGNLSLSAVWSSTEIYNTNSITWGDVDADGDLDLAVGNNGPNRLYRNNGSMLTKNASWSSTESNFTRSVAWGDVDGDGDLDLAVGSWGGPKRLYRNDRGTLTRSSIWASTETDYTTSVAWGDYDGDGDLDLAAGNNGQPIRLYRNDGGRLTQGAVWSSAESSYTWSVAWGDYDGDGDLDLAAGNDGANRLYRNDNGALTQNAVWSSSESDFTYSVAWGDVDGDGDLDLAAGNWKQPNRLYLNNAGRLSQSAVWSSAESDSTRSVAWGDVDGDGDLDLAVGNWGELNRLYRNDAGLLTQSAVWSSIESDKTTSIAWGDADADGDLDLAVGNYYGEPNRLYRNDDGLLTQSAVWSSGESDTTYSIAWGDVDTDGDLDLLSGNDGRSRLYRSLIFSSPGYVPRIQISRPSPPDGANFYSTPNIWSDLVIPIQYKISYPLSSTVSLVQAFYSLNGGGEWEPAIAASGTITRNLASNGEYIYYWDVATSGFFGQSDNVVFRMVAVPAILNRPNTIPGPYLFASSASQTFFPFRVRGTQVRVMESTLPFQGAVVYRVPRDESSAGKVITDLAGKPFLTDNQGYLQGRGPLELGDQLIALAPITSTNTYTLYFTSAAPNLTGVDPHLVTQSGVQTLTVSSANPLILFNLDISLQWDARNDPEYLSQLEYSLQRASEILYDWTDGQAALGRLTIYQNRDRWNDANIRIYATNRLRPMALQGGITSGVLHDQENNKVVYAPGQVHLGPTWTRYGDPGSDLGDDWPRALAHELGHYALYLNDNYLGLNASKQLINISTCPGAMADPYRLDYPYDELHPDLNWLPGCEYTFSNTSTGRSDWSTVDQFYPWLSYRNNPGPSSLPLAVTRQNWIEPSFPTNTIVDPTFFLKYNGARYQPDSSARAFLFQDNWLIDLGNPKLDHILARGAKPGDRLCLYDLEAQKLGCSNLSATTSSMELASFPAWQPNIAVTPVNTSTLKIQVTNLASGLPLKASFYPLSGPRLNTITLNYSPERLAYENTFFLSEPSLEGYIHIYVDETATRRETVTDFSIGGNPIQMRGSGISMRGSGVSMRGSGVPVLSPDGHVMLVMDDSKLAADQFYTLYSISVLPSPLPWTTLIGRAYQLTASPKAPSLTGASIQMGYLGSEVPPGEENWLSIYYLQPGSTRWQLLPTSLNTLENYASAGTPGPGLYALLTAIQYHLTGPGWNIFPYPLQVPRPITEALTSIEGSYTTIFEYEPDDPVNPWRSFSTSAPSWANDLLELKYGGYWIYATQPITLYLKGGFETPLTPNMLSLKEDTPFPPAVYYGKIGSPVAAGSDTVTARVDGQVCGQSTIFNVQNQPVYVIDVLSNCGSLGKKVTFWIDNHPASPSTTWDNTSVHSLFLTTIARPNIYLPLLLHFP